MPIQYRKSVKVGDNARANMSKTGVSLSSKLGPLTVNSRGRSSIRIAPGWSFKLGNKSTGNLAPIMLVLSLAALIVRLTWAVIRLIFVGAVVLTRWITGKMGNRNQDEAQV